MNTENENLPVADQRGNSLVYRNLRIWPPILLLLVILVCRYITWIIADGPSYLWMIAAFGPMLAGVLIVIWWVTLSRASWAERFLGLAAVIVLAVVTFNLMDKSMQGPGFIVLSLPIGIATFAIGAVLCFQILSIKRTVITILLATIGFGYSLAIRSEGVRGDFSMDVSWRWTPTAEAEMLEARSSRATALISDVSNVDAGLENPQWPAFRGLDRSSSYSGPKIDTRWKTNPPKEVWRVPVGPAWSAFIVAGDLLFTQEQRGDMEAVVCYWATNGKEIWSQELESRFDDPLGGPGPRSTPTLDGGAIYACGGEGLVLRLDAKTGDVVWQKDLRDLAQKGPPMWGFSSSPLVTAGMVIIYAGGNQDQGLLALDCEDGSLKWSSAAGAQAYGSPQLVQVQGKSAIGLLDESGVRCYEVETGNALLTYDWKHSGYRSLQPQMVSADSMLIPTGMGSGTRLIQIDSAVTPWTASELWTSRSMRPDFSDIVVHKGYIYGLDGEILTCIDLKTGKRQWKGGRFGKGQLVLLENSDALLVISEKGEIVLMETNPDDAIELGRMQAIDGKTWNHPVVVNKRLFVRNAKEAACFELGLAQ